MRSPCKDCLVSPLCTENCVDSNKFWDKIVHMVDKYKRFIYTKNERRRKHIPDDKIKHWNRLVTLHNEHITYINKRYP